MPDYDRVLAVKKSAQPRLLSIQGVHSVGVGLKIVDGKRTDELCIMVFVEKKKAVDELPAAELIPPEIDGVKTDIYETPVPSSRSGNDGSTHRPLDGGCQMQPGGGAAGEKDNHGGTFTCIAHTEVNSKLVGLTCHHVVAAPPNATPTKLHKPIVALPNLTFSGENTPGSLILVRLPGIDVYYVTKDNDTLVTIAAGVSAKINILGNPGITATAAGAVVTVTGVDGNTPTFNARVFSPRKPDKSAKVIATVSDTTILLSGEAKGDYVAYVVWDVGPAQPTSSAFLRIAKGMALTDIANAMAGAINTRGLGVVTATASGTQVIIKGVQRLDIFVNSDTRVGQPTDSFCSICSKCCDKRIGVVVDSRVDVDTAVIQLDPGLEYKVEVAEIGPISGARADPIGQADIGATVAKRGFKSGLTFGEILSLNKDGYLDDVDPDHNPPQWSVFGRHYVGAFIVDALDVPLILSGDSGAALIKSTGPPGNQVHEVVGMIFGGDDDTALVTPIEKITEAFDFIIEVADDPSVSKTVPNFTQGMAANELEPAAPLFGGALMERLQETQREITATPEGAELAAAVSRHADEAQRLVNTNKRVATVWHRNGGPQILNGLLSMVQSRDHRLPENLEGKPLTDCLRKLQSIFMRSGSAAFAADLKKFGPRIVELSGLTYNQTLEALRAAKYPAS